jgi:hypothetical protein
MTAPKITLETAMKMKTFNDVMLPLRRAWGALSMTSDGMVVVVSESASRKAIRSLSQSMRPYLIASDVLPLPI